MEASCASDSTAQSSVVSNLSKLQSRLRKIRRDGRIKIDISKSQYALLRTVALNDMGWRVWTRQESKEDINLQWVDTYVSDEQVRRLRPYQRINHFPASNQLGKKNLLTYNINAMKKMIPKQYEFYPQTFNIPAESEAFEKFSSLNHGSYYIVKPCGDSQGRGIYLTKSIDVNTKQEMIVQQYVENPLLIDGMKFDLRIYVLLRSVSPLKIYIYEEGLSRLATCAYDKPGINNQRNMRMHLTNYAINKLSPDFIFNKSEDEDNVGHKRSYTATMKIIEGLGCDLAKLQYQIQSIIVKTIMAACPTLSKRYKELRDCRQESESVCFQILGFDILLKNDFQPILLQVNHSPSFSTDSPLDMVIKKHLILDTFNLLNLNHEQKTNYFKNRIDQDPLNSNMASSSPPRNVSRNVNRQGQTQELGAYRKIFPLDNICENDQINRTYYSVLRTQRLEKTHRLHQKCSLPSAYNRCLNLNIRLGESVLFQTRKEQSVNPSYSLYQAMSNRYNKRGHLKEVVEGQNETIKQDDAIFQFDDLSPDMIKKQQFKTTRQSKRGSPLQKKMILPITMNSVSIRLDDSFSHKKRQSISNTACYSTRPSRDFPFKIHSVLNMGGLQIQTERKKGKEGYQATSPTKETLNESLMRHTDRAGNMHHVNPNYSQELRQKIENIQLGRLKLMRSKRIDRANFIIIKSKSIQRKSTQEHGNKC